MMSTPICIRRCWLPGADGGRLYKPGEPIMPGHTPNRHFSADGIVPAAGTDKPILAPGDDPRPTARIRADIEALGVEVPAGASRKDLFHLWVSLTKEPPAEKQQAAPDKAGNPVLDLSAKELIEYAQKRYGVALSPRLKKDELVDAVLDLERRGE